VARKPKRTGKIKRAFRWAVAAVSALAAYFTAIFVIQKVFTEVLSSPMPSWLFAVLLLLPLAVGYLLAPDGQRAQEKKRVEIKLEPELYYKMQVRKLSKGYVHMTKYITALIEEDTRGTK